MKKCYFLLMSLMMCVISMHAANDDFVRGDVDLNGKVNIADVTTLIDYLLSQEWPEEELKPENTTYTVGSVPFTMIFVEGGSFTMGATAEQGSDAGSDEKPAHKVTLSPYFICSTEVTQELWLEVMGTNPSDFVGTNLPVERVSWNDCQVFIAKLNELTGMEFRLPTEAEWEYAARGGNKTKGYKYSGSNSVGTVAWYSSNSSGKTHPVGTKTPNELGIYDMSGNVCEWCQDWKGDYSSAETDPVGPSSGSGRICRGGSWYYSATFCRVSDRNSYLPTSNFHTQGLRLALSYK